MPYIPENDRERLDAYAYDSSTPGELNYVITTLLRRYVLKRGTSYQTHNDIMGALAGVQQEWYRRVVSSYEDYKIQQNGDIF